MSDTFFTTSPDWVWYIIPYFFIGGIAGGALFLAGLLEWFGGPEDRPVIRTGYYVAAIGAMLSGILLILDLGRPLRFWHMLFQSEAFPRLAFKSWSPISFGAWILLLFGAFATIAALGAFAENRGARWSRLHALRQRTPARAIALIGGLLGLAFAGYTGILLSVSNRPIWADSNFVGLLFVVSATSTAAATLILLGGERGAKLGSIAWLARFDVMALLIEFVVIVVFLVSLGSVVRVWLSAWGAVLLIGVIGVGILVPLSLHWQPQRFGRWAARPHLTAAVLVLIGGFLLRLTVLLASAGIGKHTLTKF